MTTGMKSTPRFSTREQASRLGLSIPCWVYVNLLDSRYLFQAGAQVDGGGCLTVLLAYAGRVSTYEQSSILAYQGLREGMPQDTGIMQKVPKAIGPPPKRCPLSPRLKCNCLVAETPKAIPLFSAAPKPRKSDRTPPIVHRKGLYKEY